MRRWHIYCLGLLLIVSIGAQAQKRILSPEIYLGVHGGVLGSTVLFSPTIDYMSPLTKGAVLGGTGGLVFRYSEQKCCAVQVELNYMQRGWRETGKDANNIVANYTRNLHYLELPFLMHIYFGSPSFRGFVNLGPQIGYCIKEDIINHNPEGIPERPEYQKLEHPFDWGIAGGLGFYYRSRNAGVYQLEVRANYSLGTLFDNKVGADLQQSNSLNVGIHLAWLWEFKKDRGAAASSLKVERQRGGEAERPRGMRIEDEGMRTKDNKL